MSVTEGSVTGGNKRGHGRQAVFYGVTAAAGVIILAAAGVLANVLTEGWQLWPGVALIGLVSVASALAYFAESRSHLATTAHPPGLDPSPIELRVSTLPRGISGFTGRDKEIAEIVRTVRAPSSSGVRVCALEGMGGIGKTALAVHVAHLVADSYPDVQLFVDLRAHAAERAPLEPGAALELLLTGVGVPADQIPDGVDARAARWRALAARRKCLLVLDDAAGPHQVRPLLPGTGQALVIITSRTRMTDLEDARTFSIDVMDARDSRALLTRAVGDPAVREPDVAELASLLGGVPLALCLAAGRLRAHRTWRVADLVAELNETADGGHGVTGRVHRSFDLSCRQLDRSELGLFCHLGLSPVPHLTAEVAQAITRIPAEEAIRGLDTLHDRHLLEEVTPGRFRFHDMIRRYGAELAEKELSPVERRSARRRIVDHYANAAEHADHVLRPLPRREAGPGEEPPATFWQALKWFDEELPNLMACAQTALDEERNPQAWRLVVAMSYVLRMRNTSTVALDLLRSASELADRHHDRRGTADSWRELGVLEARLARYTQARTHADLALEIYVRLGDTLGQANAHRDLGQLDGREGRLPDARRHTSTALANYEKLDAPYGQCHAHLELGLFDLLDRHIQAALAHLNEALRLAVRHADYYGQFRAHLALSEGRLRLRDTEQALHHAVKAGEIASRLQDQLAQASCQVRIGVVHAAAENFAAARDAWTTALGFYRETEHPAAVAVQRLVARLSATPRQPFTSESLYSIDGAIW